MTPLHETTIFTVRYKDQPVNSFTTDTYLSEEAALDAARKDRDSRNASEYGQANGSPYRITRCRAKRLVKPL